ncbi:MAG TPA: hypothetical protein VK162_02070 [Streptosporangiaceae bacterium]|nr:hypothetical protein [Streptosporangiaceae bacterium]
MRAALAYLTVDGLVSETAIDAAVDTLAKGPRLPKVAEMAERIETERDRAAAVGLYREYYVPLSHFFTHPSGFTLMRHVRPDKKLRRRPEAPWPRRSVVRRADACAGQLAAAIAEKTASPAEPLRGYAAAHADRILAPVSTMGAGGILRKADWRRLPATIRAVKDLRRYLATPGAAAEPAECEARIRAGIAEAFRFLRFDANDEALMQVAVDDTVARILRTLDSPAEDQAGTPVS